MVMTDLPDGVSRQRLIMRDRAQPEPEGPFDVLVRVAAAGVCRSDLHILMGELPVSVPDVLGHENSGWVYAVGPMVSSVGVGDPVLCYPFVSILGFGGSYYAVGMGSSLSTPILPLVANETRIEGVYVGTYPELVELTRLALRGDVRPVVVPYSLSDADRALQDLAAGAFVGRAVLIP